MRRGAKKIGLMFVTAMFFTFGVSLVQAELIEHGGLFVRFSGGITPDALPRLSRAPISVRISGTVKTLSGERPPALRRIAIAINRGGRLDTRGLPVCREDQIDPSSTEEALAACGSALVGEGRFDAAVAFPEQSSFPSHGRIVAFNAVVDGRRAILAHVYGRKPVPITRIIIFRIRETPGTFGTVLNGSLPASVNRYGYVKSLSLSLHRNYTYRGRPHTYLSAACAAPAGFSGATFSFAHASMTFADGRTLASTLTRSCRVRGG
jgi:hypothetical protein